MKADRLLTGDETSAFRRRVDEAVSMGLQIHGSPTHAVDAGRGRICCAQAVTREFEGPASSDMMPGRP